jgi:hypothetical protein
MASEENFLDEDCYPTEEAIERIENWSYNDPRGWFKFIESIWYLRSCVWSEVRKADLNSPDKIEYHISTAGWSGNEDIIRAMQKNKILWSDTWVQWRTGGHYIFEVKNIGE